MKYVNVHSWIVGTQLEEDLYVLLINVPTDDGLDPKCHKIMVAGGIEYEKIKRKYIIYKFKGSEMEFDDFIELFIQ